MNDVGVPESGPEVYHDVLPQHPGEGLGPDPVPEHPPGHRHHPHHDEHHRDDVVQQTAAELAEAAHVAVAARHLLGDPGHADVEADSEQEQDPDAQAARDQEPGHVGLGGAVGVRLTGSIGLNVSQNYYSCLVTI